MSHFTVLVIGDDIDGQLEPYYEQGNPEDYFMKFEDATERLKDDYENGTISGYEAEGKLFHGYQLNEDKLRELGHITDSQLNGLSDGDKYKKILNIRESLLKEHPIKNFYKDFKEYARDQGYCENEEGLFGYYNNPDAKWDWYQIGGRWAGMFKLKSPDKILVDYVRSIGNGTLHGLEGGELEKLCRLYVEDPDKFDEVVSKYRGKSREIKQEISKLFGEGSTIGYCNRPLPNFSWGWSEEAKNRVLEKGNVDQAMKIEIDFDGMRDEVGKKAAKFRHNIFKGLDDNWKHITMDEVARSFGFNNAEESFNNKEVFQKIKDKYWEQHTVKSYLKFSSFAGYPDIDHFFSLKHDEFVASERESFFSTYAVLKDGVWYGKGDMGWFGVSFNDDKDWNKSFSKLLDDVPNDTLLTIVDCHI